MTDKQDGYPNLVRGQKGIMPAAAHNHVSGRKSVVQELNDLLHIGVDGVPRYTVAELEEVVKDPTQPPSRILAARRVLSACRDGRRYVKDKHGNVFEAGSDPEPGRDFDRIVDRMEGKPVARIEHESGPNRSMDQIRSELLRLVDKNPQLVAMLQMKSMENQIGRHEEDSGAD
jgi:hypothetical protein